jgi:hypothetical protein
MNDSKKTAIMRSLVLACFAVQALMLTPAWADKPNPKKLMEKSEARHRVAVERSQAVMVLQSNSGGKRSLSYESVAAQDDRKGDKVRVTFSSPADVRGTQLLRVENPKAKDDEQWLYLPAFKKTRRVGSAELGDRFLGSDVYFEDMKRRYVDDYSFKLIGEERVDGVDCYVIESRPAAAKVKKDSPYGKSQAWMRKDNLFVIKARHFDTRLRPLKEVRFSKLTKVSGKAWRAGRIEMVDVRRKHRTVILIKGRKLEKAIAKGTFSKHALGSR